MADNKEGTGGNGEENVYRISTAAEWEEVQSTGKLTGGELDKTSGFIHLSNLHQVQSTLQNFFLNCTSDLYLLQVDAKMKCMSSGQGSRFVIMTNWCIPPPDSPEPLVDGLIYEVVDGSNVFPHFYGPGRSFSPLPLEAVKKAEKLILSGGQFVCSLLN